MNMLPSLDIFWDGCFLVTSKGLAAYESGVILLKYQRGEIS